jgi:hypothetical protein
MFGGTGATRKFLLPEADAVECGSRASLNDHDLPADLFYGADRVGPTEIKSADLTLRRRIMLPDVDLRSAVQGEADGQCRYHSSLQSAVAALKHSQEKHAAKLDRSGLRFCLRKCDKARKLERSLSPGQMNALESGAPCRSTISMSIVLSPSPSRLFHVKQPRDAIASPRCCRAALL